MDGWTPTEATEPVISWSEAIVAELRRLIGPAVFVVNVEAFDIGL